MKVILTILLLCSGLFQCHHSYKFIVGKTYFSESSGGSEREYSALADLQVQNNLTLKGVYGQKRIGRSLLPAIFTFTVKGIAYAILADTLAVKNNTYIQVKGKPVVQKLSFGLQGVVMEFRTLQVSEFHELLQTSPFIGKSSKEYEKIYKNLESSLKPENVKNWKLAPPRWRSIINEKKDQVIVSSNTADSMYRYEINFVYQLKDGSLVAVYCRQWFKGE